MNTLSPPLLPLSSLPLPFVSPSLLSLFLPLSPQPRFFFSFFLLVFVSFGTFLCSASISFSLLYLFLSLLFSPLLRSPSHLSLSLTITSFRSPPFLLSTPSPLPSTLPLSPPFYPPPLLSLPSTFPSPNSSSRGRHNLNRPNIPTRATSRLLKQGERDPK